MAFLQLRSAQKQRPAAWPLPGSYLLQLRRVGLKRSRLPPPQPSGFFSGVPVNKQQTVPYRGVQGEVFCSFIGNTGFAGCAGRDPERDGQGWSGRGLPVRSVGSHAGEERGELRNNSVRLFVGVFLFCCVLCFFFSRRQLCLLSPSVWKYCHSKLLLHECLLYFPLGNLCLGSFNQEQTLNTSRRVHLC